MPEVAAYISGGGFSDYFLRPNYQHVAVSSFLQVETLENVYRGMYKCVLHLGPDLAYSYIIIFAANRAAESLTSPRRR